MDKSNYSLLHFVNPARQSIAEFCRTMAHRGEIVKKVVQDSGLSVTRVADKIRISRAQLYIDFANPEMSFDRILAIGKLLKHDFSGEFKELSSSLVSLVNEETTPFASALNDCRDKLLETQAQLIDTMFELNQYKAKYGPTITAD
jgi:hypothetical protein